MSLNPTSQPEAEGTPHGGSAPQVAGDRLSDGRTYPSGERGPGLHGQGPHLQGLQLHAGSQRGGAAQGLPGRRMAPGDGPGDDLAHAGMPPQDLPIRIARDGTWTYRGSPIRRRELVCLFSQALTRDAQGTYWLITPRERGRITVDDVPWMAVEMFWSGEGKTQAISFRTNVDEVVTAGRDHRIRLSHDLITCHPTPYVHVRDGLEARIARPVYYELVALSVPERQRGAVLHGVWSCGEFFPVGEIA